MSVCNFGCAHFFICGVIAAAFVFIEIIRIKNQKSKENVFMKKTVSLIVAICCLLLCCSCGANGDAGNVLGTTEQEELKVKIVNNNGETEYLTSSELKDIKEANPLNFENVYWNSSVTARGKISSILGKHYSNGTYYPWKVIIEGGWSVADLNGRALVSENFIATLNVGDEVEISGKLTCIGEISNGEVNIVKL